jgi:3-oxoadipate enol-lactonase
MGDSRLTHHILERNGCSIHYWLIGDVDRPLVTFIHGACADHHIFDSQILAVAQYFRVLVWDLRDHGLSQPAEIPFSVGEAVNDLIALLDYLGYVQCTVIGISLGGNIAQQVVWQIPERVTTVIVIAALCNTLTMAPITRFSLWLFLNVVQHAPIWIIRRILAFFAAFSHETQLCTYKQFIQLPAPNFRRIMSEIGTVIRPTGISPDYRIFHPLLLLHGQYDWNKCLMPRWARREPNCRYIIIPGAGHLANWDNTMFFNRILIEFLVEYLKP